MEGEYGTKRKLDDMIEQAKATHASDVPKRLKDEFDRIVVASDIITDKLPIKNYISKVEILKSGINEMKCIYDEEPDYKRSVLLELIRKGDPFAVVMASDPPHDPDFWIPDSYEYLGYKNGKLCFRIGDDIKLYLEFEAHATTIPASAKMGGYKQNTVKKIRPRYDDFKNAVLDYLPEEHKTIPFYFCDDSQLNDLVEFLAEHHKPTDLDGDYDSSWYDCQIKFEYMIVHPKDSK